MAITENNFTAAELETAIKENPDVLNIIKGVATNNETVKAALEPEFIGPYTKRQAELIEADVLALTGVKKKDANEKYYDYWKRAVTESKENEKKIQAELESLRSKGNPSQADKDRISQLEAALSEKDAELQKQLSEKDSAIKTLKVETAIAADLAELRSKYVKNIPESVLKLVEANAMQRLKTMAQVQDDGALTFVGEDGKVILNKSGDYKPTGAKALLELELKEIIDSGKQQGGAGSDAGQGGNQGGGTEAFSGWPAEVKTRTQATEHLLKLGVAQDSEDFAKHFETLPKDMPLR